RSGEARRCAASARAAARAYRAANRAPHHRGALRNRAASIDPIAFTTPAKSWAAYRIGDHQVSALPQGGISAGLMTATGSRVAERLWSARANRDSGTLRLGVPSDGVKAEYLRGLDNTEARCCTSDCRW